MPKLSLALPLLMQQAAVTEWDNFGGTRSQNITALQLL